MCRRDYGVHGRAVSSAPLELARCLSGVGRQRAVGLARYLGGPGRWTCGTHFDPCGGRQPPPALLWRAAVAAGPLLPASAAHRSASASNLGSRTPWRLICLPQMTREPWAKAAHACSSMLPQSGLLLLRTLFGGVPFFRWASLYCCACLHVLVLAGGGGGIPPCFLSRRRWRAPWCRGGGIIIQMLRAPAAFSSRQPPAPTDDHHSRSALDDVDSHHQQGPQQQAVAPPPWCRQHAPRTSPL